MAKFEIQGGRYVARAGAELQQFAYLAGGPAAGRTPSLPATMPPALTGWAAGRYVTTGERNRADQLIYRWEPET
jgi:hypothetical protein